MAEKTKDNVVSFSDTAKENLNPKQAELNSILTTGKYILIDSVGHSLVMGMENPELILNLLDAVKNKVTVTVIESAAYDYADQLRQMVEKKLNVTLTNEAPAVETKGEPK